MTEPDDMHDKHYDNVLEMSPDERYTYFITTVCGTDEVFYLVRGDDIPTLEDSETGRTALPVWPHARLAASCADRGFEGTEPHSAPLDNWLDFLDRLDEDETLVALMLYPDDSFLRVEPADLRRDLEDWLERAYDPDAQPRY